MKRKRHDLPYGDQFEWVPSQAKPVLIHDSSSSADVTVKTEQNIASPPQVMSVPETEQIDTTFAKPQEQSTFETALEVQKEPVTEQIDTSIAKPNAAHVKST